MKKLTNVAASSVCQKVGIFDRGLMKMLIFVLLTKNKVIKCGKIYIGVAVRGVNFLKDYFTVAGYAVAEWEINRSKFISYVCAADNEEDARAFIDRIKKQHWDATHNCSAFIVGENDEHQKADDDGEPSGTAGKPILEVLKKANLHNTVIVVTRYFGGVKLGTGGLIRAYGKSAALGIKAAGIIQKKVVSRYKIIIDYGLIGKFENILLKKGYTIEKMDFSDVVTVRVLVEKDKAEKLVCVVNELSSGTAIIQYEGEDWLELAVDDKLML